MYNYFDIQAKVAEEKRTGLLFIGRFPLGRYDRYDYFRCPSCGTEYPMIDGTVHANGHTINRCLCKERTL